MARNEAAKMRQGVMPTKGGKIRATRSATEGRGTRYGASKAKTDASVKRAKAKETDPRLIAAAKEREAHEAKLAALAAELENQPHVPYFSEETVAEFVARSTEESGVPLKVEDPETIQKVATLLSVPEPKSKPTRPPGTHPDDLKYARELLRQGYHVVRVAERTGVPIAYLKKFVKPTGYLT